MFKIKRNAFTLIELVAVLVIMAIIALIVTPLVMTITKKARISADKRSVDAYGRSIELAIAGYLMDNGSFPTDINQLTIEYSGDEVVCTTTKLNSDSSVYLAGCTVGGRSVGDYTYGSDNSPSYTAYSVGDEITYNNVDYYVIKDSSTSDSTVTLLKAEPLSVAEVNQYGGVGTANNHVNMHNCVEGTSCYKTAYDSNGYGGVAYYTSINCGHGTESNNTDIGCITNYNQSDIKYIVDAWATDKVPNGIKEARLIKFQELLDDLGYEFWLVNPSTEGYVPSENTPNFVYNGNSSYWTMSQYEDSTSNIWKVSGGLNNVVVCSGNHVINDLVRPVIVLDKSVLSS